ncbi:serine hydrolase domain-containing protein [Sphingomonas pokkalii]|nr:serine hydrolase domain-containing protein [Sphingomonas pokkalii]
MLNLPARIARARSRFLRAGGILVALSCLAPAIARAEDYKPVVCTARAPYAGRPLHAAVAVPPPAAVPDSALDPATTARLDAALAAIKAATHAPSITAAVGIEGKGMWSGDAAGQRPLFWASAGKTFTAIVVLQLVQERKLSLDDTVSTWIPGVPNGKVVTVRDLLAHTGGLFSANEDKKAHAAPRYRDPAETLAIARKHGALFCPGANWRYSNTGYDLLGEIVRRVDGRSIDAAITARILTPLGLTSLRALPPGGGAEGVAPLVSAQAKPIDPSWAGAAGPIVGSASDMVRFWSALLGGRLIAPSLVQEMTGTLYPMFDSGTFYGLGAMVFDAPDGDRRLLWIGHAGGTPGASALVVYAPADHAFAAVALTGDGSAVASVNALLKATRQPPAREAAAAATTVAATAAPPGPQGSTANWRDAIDAARDDGFNGVALTARGKTIDHVAAIGVADAAHGVPLSDRSRFEIGSMSKWIASVIVLKLVDQGKLDLDTPIARYLPDYRADNGARLTLRRLMSHSSGLPNDILKARQADPASRGVELDMQEAVRRYASGDLAFAPGTQWEYSQSNWILVQAVVERVGGTSYKALVDRLLVRPLGLADSGIYAGDSAKQAGMAVGYSTLSPTPQPKPNPIPGFMGMTGGFYTTAPDLLVVMDAVLSGQLLRPESRKALTTIQMPEQHYALGGRIRSARVGGTLRDLAWEDGSNGGFRMVARRVLADGHSVIVLNNASWDYQKLGDFADALLETSYRRQSHSSTGAIQ